jgi:hypothetical protein
MTINNNDNDESRSIHPILPPTLFSTLAGTPCASVVTGRPSGPCASSGRVHCSTRAKPINSFFSFVRSLPGWLMGEMQGDWVSTWKWVGRCGVVVVMGREGRRKRKCSHTKPPYTTTVQPTHPWRWACPCATRSRAPSCKSPGTPGPPRPRTRPRSGRGWAGSAQAVPVPPVGVVVVLMV